MYHDYVIKWECPRYWPFVRGIHQWQVNSPHKGQWRRALIFLKICVWTKDWANHPDAGDFSRHCAHYDVTVMIGKRCWCRNRNISDERSQWRVGETLAPCVKTTKLGEMCTDAPFGLFFVKSVSHQTPLNRYEKTDIGFVACITSTSRHVLAIPIYVTARACRTYRDACRDY